VRRRSSLCEGRRHEYIGFAVDLRGFKLPLAPELAEQIEISLVLGMDGLLDARPSTRAHADGFEMHERAVDADDADETRVVSFGARPSRGWNDDRDAFLRIARLRVARIARRCLRTAADLRCFRLEARSFEVPPDGTHGIRVPLHVGIPRIGSVV